MSVIVVGQLAEYDFNVFNEQKRASSLANVNLFLL